MLCSLENGTTAVYRIPLSCQSAVHKTSQAANLTRTRKGADFHEYQIMVIQLNRIELQRKSTLDQKDKYEWDKLHLEDVIGSHTV